MVYYIIAAVWYGLYMLAMSALWWFTYPTDPRGIFDFAFRVVAALVIGFFWWAIAIFVFVMSRVMDPWE